MKHAQKEIESLLESVEGFEMTKPETTAYNYLCEFVDLGHLDGERLFSLCEDLMKEVLKRNVQND